MPRQLPYVRGTVKGFWVVGGIGCCNVAIKSRKMVRVAKQDVKCSSRYGWA